MISRNDSVARLSGLPFLSKIELLEECASTNTLAKEKWTEYDPGSTESMSIIWTMKQTAGRGRLDRSFFSSVYGGLWVTIIVRLNDLSEHFGVNRALSLAICESLPLHAPVKIKWPNDIYWGNRKICGMLLETMSDSPPLIAAGFGLNLNMGNDIFPAELENTATSAQIETDEKNDLDETLYAILTGFDKNRRFDNRRCHSLYRKRLYGIGRSVRINGREGILSDVREDGCLVIEHGNAIEHIVSGSLDFVDIN